MSMVDRSRDRRDLGGGLAFAEDHLGKSLAQRTVMIDFGKAQVFERKVAHALKRLGDGDLAPPHAFQKLRQAIRIHDNEASEIRICF
jgi:hypothetical protein